MTYKDVRLLPKPEWSWNSRIKKKQNTCEISRKDKIKMAQRPHWYCTNLVCRYQLQPVAFVTQTFFDILFSFCLPLYFTLLLRTANLCTSPIENVSIKKYSNGTVYKDSGVSIFFVPFRSLQQQEPWPLVFICLVKRSCLLEIHLS